MKRLTLLIAFLFAPAMASAQETILSAGIAITAVQEQQLTSIVATLNSRTCLRVNAAGGEACTQAQACTAIGNPTNCASTPATARALNVRIYPNTNDAAGTAGRTEFVTFVYIVPNFVAGLGDPTSFEYERVCANWSAFTDTQRNTACQDLGRTSSTVAQPCRLCP
jgi:hypothetical protein